MPSPRHVFALAGIALALACARSPRPDSGGATIPESRPSILLVTLDTTRADAIGPHTPSFNEVSSRGRRFHQAYAPVPETLPSHTSMMTGLYPAAHGVYENLRYVSEDLPLLAPQLRQAGYATAAFVSGSPLLRQFGLARGFDRYDDELPNGRADRSARETTDRALAHLRDRRRHRPLFLWVHYFDPHQPYEPPQPFRDKYPNNLYAGEVAAMDQELGRLVKAFRKYGGDSGAIVIAGDHGESLGEHGETQHGHLLYQGPMHVPLVIAGPGVNSGETNTPVSTRRVYHTILDWAGLGLENSLRRPGSEVVLGEAMRPFLEFGWQPQIMALEGRLKVIHAGKIEIYDVIADPNETCDLADSTPVSRQVRQALLEYPIPSRGKPHSIQNLTDEDRDRLASLGYVVFDAAPAVRKNAARPRDMTHLIDELDQALGFFVREEYASAIPLLERILTKDPHNLAASLQLATAYSSLGDSDRALSAFGSAEALAPDSSDVRHYLGLHYVRFGKWQEAAPLLEKVLVDTPVASPRSKR